MPLSPAAAGRINHVVDLLDRYVARHRELVLELEQHTQLATALTGYEQMRAASNAKVARAKIAMYEPEIELLRHQIERWAYDANIRASVEGLERSEPTGLRDASTDEDRDPQPIPESAKPPSTTGI